MPPRPRPKTEDNVTGAAGAVLGAIFKPLELLWKAIPQPVQIFLIGALVLLVIYPLISFVAVVYLLDFVPDRFRLPLQDRALSSWGLERVYSNTAELNANNRAVDTSTHFQAGALQPKQWDQYVMPGQMVRLWASASRSKVLGNSGECVEDVQDVDLGTLSFRINEIGWRKPQATVTANPKLSQLLSLDASDWVEINRRRGDVTPLPLTIHYRPSPASPDNALLRKCFEYDVDVYLEVYKPPLHPAGTG